MAVKIDGVSEVISATEWSRGEEAWGEKFSVEVTFPLERIVGDGDREGEELEIWEERLERGILTMEVMGWVYHSNKTHSLTWRTAWSLER